MFLTCAQKCSPFFNKIFKWRAFIFVLPIVDTHLLLFMSVGKQEALQSQSLSGYLEDLCRIH